MCTNKRYIENIYTHRGFYTDCGKCPSCLQEKAAHRVARMKNTKTSSVNVLMVSLTYSRGTCPYILRSDAYKFAHGDLLELPIHRDSSFRLVRSSSDYAVSYKRTDDDFILDTILYNGMCSFKGLKDLKYEHGKIGVCYYKDIQHFMSRLRINLKRNFNYEKPFKAYCCSEYGAKSFRPHFHLALFFDSSDTEIFRNAVFKSWPFSDLRKFPRSVEVAFRANSYLASYVNCGSNFPRFLQKYASPKHSYSKGFGFGNPFFRLDSILRLFQRGTLSYNTLVTENGLPRIKNVSLPAYVIHRYFPKFKGYSRINPTSLYETMQRIRNFEYDKVKAQLDKDCLYYSSVDFNRISVLLNNAYDRFCKEAPDNYKSINFFSYAILHDKIWRLHKSEVLRIHLQDTDIPLIEKYDNLEMVEVLKSKGFVPIGFENCNNLEVNPNKFSSNIFRTRIMSESYYEHIKHRKVNNAVMSLTDEQW